MNSVAFTVGTWPVYWYGVLISSAMIIGAFLIQHLAKKRGYDIDQIWTVFLITVPCAVIGARLYYVIFSWDIYRDHLLSIFMIWHGGLAIHGGLLAGIATIVLCCRHYKIDAFGVLDCCAPAVALGQAIGRWGNFFNGEAYGGVTNLPWGIHVAADPYLHHPTFLYESIWDFLLFLFLWRLFPKTKHTGIVLGFYLLIYSFGRFWIEGLRTDSLMLGPLRQAQLLSLCLMIAGALILYLRKKSPLLTANPTKKK